MLLMTKTVCVCLAEFDATSLYNSRNFGICSKNPSQRQHQILYQGLLRNDEMRFCWQGIQEGGCGANTI